MNPVLDQFNALVTSMRMVENENEKLKTKLEELESEDAAIKEDLKKAEDDLAKSEVDFKALKDDHTQAIANLDAEIAKSTTEAALKGEEKDLYFEIKLLEQEITLFKETNEYVVHELEDVKAGKFTPGFSKHLQSKLNKDNKSKLLEHYGKTIAVDRQNGLVTMATIERIFDATILYYSNNHISRTYDDRIERRKHLGEIDKYLDIAVRQLNDFDNSVDAAQLEILEKLGLTLEDFSASVEFYFTQGNQDVYLLTSMIPQKLKMFMPARKRLSVDTVRDLLKYQKEILPVEFLILDIIKKYKDDLTPDRVTTLLSNRLLDKVYEKFNIEEEDFTAAIQTSECRNDQDIKTLLIEIRNAILEQVPKTIQSTFNEAPIPAQQKKK
jgi:hypothetical protein